MTAFLRSTPGYRAVGGAALVERQVASKSRMWRGVSTTNVSNVRYNARSSHSIFSKCQRAKVKFTGFAPTITDEGDITNDIKVQFAIRIGAQVVQATFGGQLQGIIPAGAAEYWSDWLYASAFGLPYFQNTACIFHTELQVNPGEKLPTAQTGREANEAFTFDNGSGASQILSTAALTGTSS